MAENSGKSLLGVPSHCGPSQVCNDGSPKASTSVLSNSVKPSTSETLRSCDPCRLSQVCNDAVRPSGLATHVEHALGEIARCEPKDDDCMIKSSFDMFCRATPPVAYNNMITWHLFIFNKKTISNETFIYIQKRHHKTQLLSPHTFDRLVTTNHNKKFEKIIIDQSHFYMLIRVLMTKIHQVYIWTGLSEQETNELENRTCMIKNIFINKNKN